MILAWRRLHPGRKLAGAAFFVAVATFAWALVRALTIVPVHAEMVDLGWPMAAPPPRGVLPDSALGDFVALDPFHPERRQPEAPFRLPGERVAQRPRAPGLPESLRLVGTMLYGGGDGVAVLRSPAGGERILRVGERLGGLTLKRVSQGQAVFVSTTGSVIVIQVTKGGA